MTTETPAAILWDMDGTLVDTEPYWMRAERELVGSFGGNWTAEDGLALVGQGLSNSALALKSRGVDLPVDEIIDRLTHHVLSQTIARLPWRPGALELLRAVRSAGIRTALVTMSMKPLADHIAHALGEELFDVVVTGGDVTRPKPDPEPYVRAAELLSVDPAHCVAIEDSLPGLASAVAAGTIVIGVPAHVALPDDDDYTLWPTLAARTVDDVLAVFRDARVRVDQAGSQS